MNNGQDSWALVTGASRGLGKAFAEACAAEGHNLILVSLPGEGLPAVARSIETLYSIKTSTYEVDLSTDEGRNVVTAALSKMDLRLDLLVNNAGIGRNGAFDEETLAFHQRVVDLNIQSTMALTYALIPLLGRSAPSRIITVASLAAFQPMPLFATYAASKAFLKSWGLALAEELAPLGIGSTVLAPGGIYTNDEVRHQVRSQGLGGRLSTQEPEVVARIALAAAQKGKPLVIPGAFNRLLALAGGIVPDELKAKAVYSRWRKALERSRRSQGLAGALSSRP